MTIKNNYDSTLDSPLKYFEYFILNSGFKAFYNEFYNEVARSYSVCWNLNKEEGFIEVGSNNENFGTQKIYFSDKLEKHLTLYRLQSYSFIKQKIDSFVDEIEIVIYLKKLIGQLNHLIINIIRNKNISKEQVTQECIYNIIAFLHETYNPFFEDIQSPCITEAYKFLHKRKTQNSQQSKIISGTSKGQKLSKPVTAFKWKVENTYKLYGLLLNENYIPHDGRTGSNFWKGFSGETLDYKLEIRWKLAQKEEGSKTSLIRLIELLMFDLELIEPITKHSLLAATIKAVFVDSDGDELEDLDVSVNQHSKKTYGIIENDLHKVVKEALY